MRHTIARTMQFLGLIILPIAIAAELDGQVGLGRSMLIAAGGALIFFIGYVLQHRAET